ncbi:probable phospholipid-transporting ATPase IH isoform X1 [Lates japonicus]|uniref:Probable phospholipid-transporting ATPase IH isoform X1 n=1 Tax=Lates japonicus TaxID=270547 RepID=A0AAD3NFT0_LATJO|nr:probable phospholipid-transporting ATPase IH isoform X1 [Lates japonicus]
MTCWRQQAFRREHPDPGADHQPFEEQSLHDVLFDLDLSGDRTDHGLIIDGATLCGDEARPGGFKPGTTKRSSRNSPQPQRRVCCRMAPPEKAQIVKLDRFQGAPDHRRLETELMMSA